jgi:pyoverdine/dityrosine biosynthesis protein Dit1
MNTDLLYLIAYSDTAYTLKMETAKASETSVTIYQTIMRFTPEDLKVQYRLNAMKIINRILCQI